MHTSSSGRSTQPSPVHLVLGESGAGCVRAACDTHGMPGTVTVIPDDLAHGPLDDWRSLTFEMAHAHAVVLWSGGNVGDAIFVAMACDRLAKRSEPLFRVEVPETFVAVLSPERIAQLYATRQLMSDSQRNSQALDFVRIRDTCGPVRRLDRDRVMGAPMDHYDPLLLAACSQDWRTRGQVVGLAMSHCDSRNLLSDVFFLARLDHLIDSGRIESSGIRTSLRDGWVRLIHPPHVPIGQS